MQSINAAAGAYHLMKEIGSRNKFDENRTARTFSMRDLNCLYKKRCMYYQHLILCKEN